MNGKITPKPPVQKLGSTSDITTMSPLVAKNTTHYYAMTAINSLGIESSFSEIIQYMP